MFLNPGDPAVGSSWASCRCKELGWQRTGTGPLRPTLSFRGRRRQNGGRSLVAQGLTCSDRPSLAWATVVIRIVIRADTPLSRLQRWAPSGASQSVGSVQVDGTWDLPRAAAHMVPCRFTGRASAPTARVSTAGCTSAIHRAARADWEPARDGRAQEQCGVPGARPTPRCPGGLRARPLQPVAPGVVALRAPDRSPRAAPRLLFIPRRPIDLHHKQIGLRRSHAMQPPAAYE